MKNFLQRGDSLDLIAPAGGVVSGDAILIGTSILAVAVASKAAAETFAGEITGVFELPKKTADVFAAGAKASWNNTTKEFQIATTDLDNAATVVEAVDATVSKMKVRLTPV